MYKTVSIDSSSTCTGMALFKNGKLCEHLVIDLKKEKRTDVRMDMMIGFIIKQLDSWHPNYVIIEDDFKKNNVKTLKMLTMIIGGIWGYCIQNEIYFQSVMPGTWRSAFACFEGIKDRATLKQCAMDYIRNKYGFNPIEDEADAIMIGLSIMED